MSVHVYEKDGGLLYPVRPGDVWQVEQHTVICGDLQRGAMVEALRYAQPDLVYVDPPWGLSNLNSFQTKAGLPHVDVPYQSFLEMLLHPLVQLGVPVFSEMGVGYKTALEQAAAVVGLPYFKSVPITYYGKHRALLYQLSPQPEPAHGWVMPPDGMDDELTPGWIIDQYCPQPGVVFDPCTGRGLTAVSAAKAGRQFVGAELNQYRVSVTLRKLADLTGSVPQWVKRVEGIHGSIG